MVLGALGLSAHVLPHAGHVVELIVQGRVYQLLLDAHASRLSLGWNDSILVELRQKRKIAIYKCVIIRVLPVARHIEQCGSMAQLLVVLRWVV